MTKLHKLIKGKTVQLSPDEIEIVVTNLPNLGIENYKKLEKAHRNRKGCRISVHEHELEGCGFLQDGIKFIQNNKHAKKLKDKAINHVVDHGMKYLGADEETRKVAKNISRGLVNHGLDSLADHENFNSDPMHHIKKGAQYIKNNEELSNYKNRLVNQAVDKSLHHLGADEETKHLVGQLSHHAVNRGLNHLSGEGFNLKKGLKMGAKALKVGNHVSNAMGYDNLQDLAIDTVANETLGRIDPTLGRVAGNAMKRVANKQINKYSGGALHHEHHKHHHHEHRHNPYLPENLRGEGIFHGGSVHHRSMDRVARAYNDQSNLVHIHSDSFDPNNNNLPMFDQMKLHKHMGGGFRVYA